MLRQIQPFMSLRRIIAISLLTIPLHSFAQKSGAAVSGVVRDKSSKAPVEFTTVEVLKETDSSLVSGVMSNTKGRFLISNIPAGKYILRFRFVGYDRTLMPVIISSSRQKLDVGNVDLSTSSTNMQEVVVTGKKALLNVGIDRKVYDVSQDLTAVSGAASDVLKNIPSVEVDIDGQVSLRGSSGVIILINGRPSPLMGKSRAEVLQQLPANSIERIEVITNPSAKYKPDGTSGIINIVLKKNAKMGLNGAITASAGNNDRVNSNVFLNYKPGKLNIFGSYGIRQDGRKRYNNVDREYLDSLNHSIRSYYREEGHSIARPLSHLGTIGLDYTPNSRNSFGISGNFTYRRQEKKDLVQKLFSNPDHSPTSGYDRVRFDPEWQRESDATVYWQHNFPKEEHSLRLEMQSSRSREQEDNRYQNIYHFPSPGITYDNTLIRQGDNQQHITLDYTNPLSEDAKLEAGYAGSFTQQDFDFYGEYMDPASHQFVKDVMKTNRFLYKDAIHALYGIYEQSIRNFSFQFGLRAEEVLIKGHLVTKDSTIRNDYFRIYPTLHLAYKLSKGELQLNYSRRVHRPEGDELNPFPEYQDPYNVRAGNPALLPEIIHSFEFGYKWQNKVVTFVPGLFYRYKQHGFTPVTVPLNDSVLLTTNQNLSSDQSGGLELIVTVKTGKFFSGNFSTSFFYNEINAAGLGYQNRKSIVAMNAGFTGNFALTGNTHCQISTNYRSGRPTPQGKIFPSFVLNAGIRQDVWNKKMSITLTASDLLNTMRQKSEISTTYMHQVSFTKRDARIVYLGVSYRFGRNGRKPEDKMQFESGL